MYNVKKENEIELSSINVSLMYYIEISSYSFFS